MSSNLQAAVNTFPQITRPVVARRPNASSALPSPWSAREDSRLLDEVSRHGEHQWGLISRKLDRPSSHCHARYTQHLRPKMTTTRKPINILQRSVIRDRNNLLSSGGQPKAQPRLAIDDSLLLQLYSSLGTNYTAIAQRLKPNYAASQQNLVTPGLVEQRLADLMAQNSADQENQPPQSTGTNDSNWPTWHQQSSSTTSGCDNLTDGASLTGSNLLALRQSQTLNGKPIQKRLASKRSAKHLSNRINTGRLNVRLSPQSAVQRRSGLQQNTLQYASSLYHHYHPYQQQIPTLTNPPTSIGGRLSLTCLPPPSNLAPPPLSVSPTVVEREPSPLATEQSSHQSQQQASTTSSTLSPSLPTAATSFDHQAMMLDFLSPSSSPFPATLSSPCYSDSDIGGMPLNLTPSKILNDRTALFDDMLSPIKCCLGPPPMLMTDAYDDTGAEDDSSLLHHEFDDDDLTMMSAVGNRKRRKQDMTALVSKSTTAMDGPPSISAIMTQSTTTLAKLQPSLVDGPLSDPVTVRRCLFNPGQPPKIKTEPVTHLVPIRPAPAPAAITLTNPPPPPLDPYSSKSRWSDAESIARDTAKATAWNRELAAAQQRQLDAAAAAQSNSSSWSSRLALLSAATASSRRLSATNITDHLPIQPVILGPQPALSVPPRSQPHLAIRRTIQTGMEAKWRRLAFGLTKPSRATTSLAYQFIDHVKSLRHQETTSTLDYYDPLSPPIIAPPQKL